MATSQAPGKVIAPRAAEPVIHRAVVAEATAREPAETPYLPDQITLVLLIGCVLLIFAMNLFDVITGILSW
jgi:hypothetical protein